MPETPTPHELARDIRQLEEARREDMNLLRREIRDLGDRLERRFDGLTAVSYDAFTADQARQDDQIGHLRGDVHQLPDVTCKLMRCR